jgi:hypothetical protein
MSGGKIQWQLKQIGCTVNESLMPSFAKIVVRGRGMATAPIKFPATSERINPRHTRMSAQARKVTRCLVCKKPIM